MNHLPDSGLMGLRPLDFAPEALETRYAEPPRPEEGDVVRSPALRFFLWAWIAAALAGVTGFFGRKS